MMSIYWRDAIGHERWPMSLAVTGVHVNARSEARGLNGSRDQTGHENRRVNRVGACLYWPPSY